MALPPAYDPESGAAPVSERKSSRKALAVAAGVAVAMVVCVAMLAGKQDSQRTELVIAGSTPDRSLDELAMHMLKHAATMPEKDMWNLLKAWRNNPNTILSSLDPSVKMGNKFDAQSELSEMMGDGPVGVRTQMLVGNLRSRVQLLKASDSKLCAKRDIILKKFDELLKKLGGEELALNISLGKMSAEWHAAMAGWLDSESQYRLRIEQAKEAAQGAKFAEEQYEKYRQAQKSAKENYETGLAKHDKERDELDGERKIIKMIMRYIGVLHDVKASEKSIAAGGVDSVKDEETGVSDPYAIKMAKTKAELQQKVNQLKTVVLKTKLPGSTQKLAMIDQHLAVYSETNEVAKILMDMLSDIEARLKVIDTVDEEVKKLVEDTEAKMVEWEKKLVLLANEADKAAEKMAAAKLEREKLNGDKKVSEASYDDEKQAYAMMIPPFEREIYVITMIKIKITEHCAAQEGGAA